MATDVPRFDNGKQQLCPPHLIETIRPFYHFEGQPASQPVAGGGAPSKADDDMFHAPIFWKCLSLHLQEGSRKMSNKHWKNGYAGSVEDFEVDNLGGARFESLLLSGRGFVSVDHSWT